MIVWLLGGVGRFYGKCIETLKLQALAEGSDGKLHKTQRLCKILEESSEKPSSLCGQQFDEGGYKPLTGCVLASAPNNMLDTLESGGGFFFVEGLF